MKGLFSLGFKDFAKGLIIAVLGAIVGLVSASIEAGSLNFDWALIGKTALLTTLAYLTKNFLTNNKDQFLTKDTPKP